MPSTAVWLRINMRTSFNILIFSQYKRLLMLYSNQIWLKNIQSISLDSSGDSARDFLNRNAKFQSIKSNEGIKADDDFIKLAHFSREIFTLFLSSYSIFIIIFTDETSHNWCEVNLTLLHQEKKKKHYRYLRCLSNLSRNG